MASDSKIDLSEGLGERLDEKPEEQEEQEGIFDIMGDIGTAVGTAVGSAVGTAVDSVVGSTVGTEVPESKAVKAVKAVKEKKIRIRESKKGEVRVPTTLEEWGTYRAAEKLSEKKKRLKKEVVPFEDKGNFTFTSEGDVKLTQTQTLTLTPQIRSPAIEKFFVEKVESLKELEEDFATKKRELQKAIQQYRNQEISVDDIVVLNENVKEAEQKLNAKAKLPRRIIKVYNLIEREIYLDKPYEVRKLADPVRQVVYNTFPYQAFWSIPEAVKEEQGVLPTVPEVPVVPVQLSDEEKARKRAAIIASRRAIKAAKAVSF